MNDNGLPIISTPEEYQALVEQAKAEGRKVVKFQMRLNGDDGYLVPTEVDFSVAADLCRKLDGQRVHFAMMAGDVAHAQAKSQGPEAQHDAYQYARAAVLGA